MIFVATYDPAAATADSPKNDPALRADLVEGTAVARVPKRIDWTEVPGVSLKPGMFVARVTGTSMEPLVPDGSWCLFRPCPAGSREGRIVLVQLGTDGAGENGGRLTVKKYHSEKTVTADGWRHDCIQLLPVNPAFAPIEIEPEDASNLMIVGEYATAISYDVESNTEPFKNSQQWVS
jgi:phage repressor protein C with HTH and peptisase S24 domain